METKSSSETLVMICQFAWRHIPDVFKFQTYYSTYLHPIGL